MVKIDRIAHLLSEHTQGKSLTLHYGDICDTHSLTRILDEVQPDEIYHLAAQSDVGISFSQPNLTADITGLGTLRMLEVIKQLKLKTRFYQAGSSEMYGDAAETPQNENTPFNARSPYGAAKIFAHWTTRCYRESYNLFAANGILFNHESPRRGENFVTRKITKAAVRIKLGLQKSVLLGNLDAKRDWGYAKDFVEAMWLILQHDRADDFVIATGEIHTVRDFLDKAFGLLDLEWQEYVKIDDRYIRPLEVPELRGDFSKAKKILKWTPTVHFKELVKIMIEADLKEEKKNLNE